MARTTSSLLLALTIALLGMASIPLASAAWEDCKTTKMYLKNSWMNNNIEVIAYSRLAAGQSVGDCLTKCRNNQECYSFNYNKLTKWCYLGTTEETNLRTTRNTKWAAGYRRCVEHVSNKPWTNDEFSGGAAGTGPEPVTGLTAVPTTATSNSATITFVAPTSFGIKDDGTDSALGSYKVTCTSANGVVKASVTFLGLTGPVGGLAPGGYTCSVVAVNTESLESTSVSAAVTIV